MEPLNILIIEDDRINCLIYKQILSKTEARVDFAYDGLSGLQAFVRTTYRLILLDLGLPKIGGIEVAKFMRTHEMVHGLAPTPVVIITADSTADTYNSALRAGADEYMNKPFDIEYFRSLLSKYAPPQAIECGIQKRGPQKV